MNWTPMMMLHWTPMMMPPQMRLNLRRTTLLLKPLKMLRNLPPQMPLVIPLLLLFVELLNLMDMELQI
jgi:hypothetical protein